MLVIATEMTRQKNSTNKRNFKVKRNIFTSANILRKQKKSTHKIKTITISTHKSDQSQNGSSDVPTI